MVLPAAKVPTVAQRALHGMKLCKLALQLVARGHIGIPSPDSALCQILILNLSVVLGLYGQGPFVCHFAATISFGTPHCLRVKNWPSQSPSVETEPCGMRIRAAVFPYVARVSVGMKLHPPACLLSPVQNLRLSAETAQLGTTICKAVC